MIAGIGWFVAGLVLLALGGDSAVKGSAGLARRLGLSAFATGFLLLAVSTSLPELAVNARAVWVDDAPLALGNAVGSNIVNFGLTLGLAALCAPVLVRWRVLAPLLPYLVAATVLLAVLGLDGGLSRLDGTVLLLAFVLVLALTFRRTRRQEQAELGEEFEAVTRTSTDLALNLLRLVIGVALLYFGARFVVQGAPAIGEALGMESLLTGLLVVAIGTALPEDAAAIMAARRGQGDVVVGHVLGSSLFNLLVVVGGMAVAGGIALPASFVRFELPATLAFALLLWPMLRGDLRVSRGEGAVLVVAFLGWVVFELLLVHG